MLVINKNCLEVLHFLPAQKDIWNRLKEHGKAIDALRKIHLVRVRSGNKNPRTRVEKRLPAERLQPCFILRFLLENILHLVEVDIEQGVVHERVGELTDCQKEMMVLDPFPIIFILTFEQTKVLVDFATNGVAQFRLKQVPQDRTDVVSSTLKV